MNKPECIEKKIFLLPELIQRMEEWKFFRKTVAFTNGVFDILHRGHIYSLSQAAGEADFLIVAVNSDASVKRLKGTLRPVNDQNSRALLLASLIMVDAVIIFEEDTPLELIKVLKPDVLVKGGDYKVEQIAGAAEVIRSGGRVVINPIVEGFSTSSIIQKINKN